MATFIDFLADRIAAGGFTTEDALVRFLPLARQVAAAHLIGKVAPLVGVEELRVQGLAIYFEAARVRSPELHADRLRSMQPKGSRGVEITGQYRLDVDADAGIGSTADLRIAKRGEPLDRPVYLPGYVSWEQELGHHDPLADIFVLGLIFASMTCGLDLNDLAALGRFVAHRRNLFDLAPQLHPVLAKAIVRMTELDRSRRPQDLAALVRALENYRDQDIDLDADLARAPGWKTADRPGRRALILSCLKRRLFDNSRRNRLLHFRPTSQSVNLTWASIPLAFDVESIRPDQVLTWNEKFQNAVVSGDPISLTRWLRFEDALYLPGQLDAIRNEAYRDLTEYGFAQLRLVLCFLRWANLKEKPAERFDSPLVLLPVRLVKTKGVRDVYTLEASSTEAEINPALRNLLQQLYAVDLPEQIDLKTDSLDQFFDFLRSRIQASEPAVTVEKIERPRIDLLHGQAQRRLDQYRRRLRLSGRGVRSFADLDYSYDRENYHPLGLRIFETRLTPSAPGLRAFVEEKPRPREHMMPTAVKDDSVRERRLYSQVAEETNPFRWEFDLCNVTLGNFHYRKMSLVRDYSALLDKGADNAGFDAIFSLDPRPDAPSLKETPWEEQFPIVSVDSTQASAIALARTGRHFIIQGPPGTGKSQTITNLIADYVARGLRVLFICEKRAALDVVYHRLCQAGLDRLSCLIHDSQDDKKAFVQDLKATYETFLEAREGTGGSADKKRTGIVASMRTEATPLDHAFRFMLDAPSAAGMPFRQLLDRAIELGGAEMSARDRERLPDFGLWNAHRERLVRLGKLVEELQGPAPLASHPLRLLHPRFATEERPVEKIELGLKATERLFAETAAALKSTPLPDDCRRTLADLTALVGHAVILTPLAETDTLAVLASKSPLTKLLDRHRRAIKKATADLAEARTKTTPWRRKLGADDTQNALDQARRIERSMLRFVMPAWWRLRSLFRQSYDFSTHKIAPPWSQVLETLHLEHEADARLKKAEDEARADLTFDGSFAEYQESVADIERAVERLPGPLKALHRDWATSATAKETVLHLAKLQPGIERLGKELADLVEIAPDVDWQALRDELAVVEESLDDWPDFAPCLRELAALPAPLADAWRRLPLLPHELEAATARRTADDLLRADPEVRRFTAAVQERQAGRLGRLHGDWLAANAAAILERVRERFLEHVRVASTPHAELSAGEKEFKPRYNRGRRELEHEFGKSMRYRSIRDLVAGDTGLVVRDLKPVWLMSPLSVSDTLPIEESPFDVVLFDEASQVTLEEAVPAFYRGRQVVIVGDEKQLPPTSFFASTAHAEEEHDTLDGAGDAGHDLGSDSLLNHAARKLPSTMLRWHYRSRSESLIAFSNAAFYQGRLLTVPEVHGAAEGRTPIVVTDPAEGDEVGRLLDRPVSFHLLRSGIYRERRNASEADYIARLIRSLLTRGTGHSIGVIAFSEAQQGEIDGALQRLAGEDENFRGLLEAEREREESGQFVGLIVKNLENIQGDERDVILLSVCYGQGPEGRMLMNFGPINQTGGERRLNVAFSRARKHMALVSSIRADRITNDYNDGARALKNYLRYAEAQSQGDAATARRVLREANPADAPIDDRSASSAFAHALEESLRGRGYEVERDVGESEFRVDLAVRRAGASDFALGILIDGDRYGRTADLLEREVLRPSLLRNFGWKVLRCLSKDWLASPDGTLTAIERAIKDETEPTSEATSPPADAASAPTEPVAAPPIAASPIPTDAKMGVHRLELIDGESRKFWEIEVTGASHTVRFGRIGSQGQSKTKTFADESAAQRDADRLLREKRAKGYVG
jgi:predicted DNA-binding WGR domain protein/very-short-patch-repair endonuclease